MTRSVTQTAVTTMHAITPPERPLEVTEATLEVGEVAIDEEVLVVEVGEGAI